MADIARLVLAAETSGMDKAKASLDGVAAAGAKTEAATKRAGAAYAAAGAQARTMASTHRLAVGSVSNLTAQFNDIGVMLAAGQNPLQLAIQQGTQISQVIGPMGAAGSVRALSAAFMGMISPVSLMTLGVIAGGAALFQWGMAALGAGEEAETLEGRIDGIVVAMRALNSAQSETRISIFDLTAEYGEYASAVQDVLRVQREIAAIDAQAQISATAQAISVAFGDITAALSTGESIPNIVERNFALGALVEQFDIGIAQATLLAEALVAIGEADGPDQQAEASARLREQLELAAGGLQEMDEETRAVYDALLQAELAAARLAAIDVASNIGAGADEAGRLAGNLGTALAIAQAISAQNAAEARAALNNPPAGRGGDPRRFGSDYGSVFNQPGDSGTNFPQSDMDRPGVRPEARTGIDFGLPPVGRGGGASRGGGGGRDPIEQLAQSYERLLHSLDPIARATDDFAEAQETVNAALAAGIITQEDATRVLELARAEFDQIIDATNELNDATRAGIDAIGDIFGAIQRGEGAIEIVKRLAFQMAQVQLMNGSFGLAQGSGAVAGVAGLLGRLVTPMYATGTAYHPGGDAIVGEQGIERVSLPTGSKVQPMYGSGGQGGTMRIVIEENPMFASRVTTISGGVAVEVVKENSRQMAQSRRRA